MPDCVKLTPRRAASYSWLPDTCAYRLLAEGKPLYWWHPLVSGDRDSVHAAGVSVRGRTAGDETEFSDDELAHHLVMWPNEAPAGREVNLPQSSPGRRAPARSAGLGAPSPGDPRLH